MSRKYKSDLTKEIEAYCRNPKIPDTDVGKLQQEVSAIWKFLWCLSIQRDQDTGPKEER